jgi:hypothetical protein
MGYEFNACLHEAGHCLLFWDCQVRVVELIVASDGGRHAGPIRQTPTVCRRSSAMRSGTRA